MTKRPSLIVTVPLRQPGALTVAVEVQPETLTPLAIGAVAGLAGSDLDALARQFCALMTLALMRGASLEEIGLALPREGAFAGVAVQLAPGIVEAAFGQIEAARTSLESAGLSSREPAP